MHNYRKGCLLTTFGHWFSRQHACGRSLLFFSPQPSFLLRLQQGQTARLVTNCRLYLLCFPFLPTSFGQNKAPNHITSCTQILGEKCKLLEISKIQPYLITQSFLIIGTVCKQNGMPGFQKKSLYQVRHFDVRATRYLQFQICYSKIKLLTVHRHKVAKKSVFNHGTLIRLDYVIYKLEREWTKDALVSKAPFLLA